MLRAVAKRSLKKYASGLLGTSRIYKHLVRNRQSFIYTSGWYESACRDYPCLASGEPVPWMNYAAIELLRGRLGRDMRLLEFGSGYSTLFWSSLVKHVVAIESSPLWYAKVLETLPDNAELIHVPEDVDGQYCRCGDIDLEAFDVVVVDGVDRVNCLRRGMDRLTTDGVLILDDSHRSAYEPGIAYVQARGFKTLELVGMKQYGYRQSSTTIMYRSDNCLGI
jgi:hypothetical protein